MWTFLHVDVKKTKQVNQICRSFTTIDLLCSFYITFLIFLSRFVPFKRMDTFEAFREFGASPNKPCFSIMTPHGNL